MIRTKNHLTETNKQSNLPINYIEKVYKTIESMKMKMTLHVKFLMITLMKKNDAFL